MKLRPDQLDQHLAANVLLPIYVISGDEPLQMMEACDAIREQARQQGFEERTILDVQRGFNWQELFQHADSLSLFASRKILECRLSSPKPGTDGAKALRAYAENPPQDTLLLITCGKLDQASQKAKWFQALEKTGAVISVWPIDANRLPQWIMQRFSQQGRTVSREAAQYLSDRVEGNLLAASQEVTKLCLLTDAESLDLDAVLSVGDNARYDVFKLVDAVLEGDADRSLRILDGLHSEGQEPIIIHWALQRECRALHSMACDMAAGQSLDTIFRQHRVWSSRAQPVRQALNRLKPAQLRLLIDSAALIERELKGASPIKANPWTSLTWLVLRMAGQRLERDLLISLSERRYAS